jgi:hypothetical protein
MARPLNKHDRNGNLYTRPTKIEAALDAALGQDLPALQARAIVRERDSPKYLPSECLVYFVRDAIRRDHHETMNTLLPLLLARCEATLGFKVPDTVPNAQEIRDEILGEFAEFFAEDGKGDNPDKLDFYEIRFNKAFRALRVDIHRRHASRLNHESLLSDSPPRKDHVQATQGDDIALMDRLSVLTPEERRAVELCIIQGYDHASAAKLCGVTVRTIYNRLKEAFSKLKEHL